MRGQSCNNCRIRGSTSSTTDPTGARSYLGGISAASLAFTVFFEIPNCRAITLIGIFSAKYNRRISAQSSTCNIPFVLPARLGARVSGGSQFSGEATGSVFTCRRQLMGMI